MYDITQNPDSQKLGNYNTINSFLTLGLENNYPLSIKKRLEKLTLISGSNIHWYGKTRETPGRKMGHLTFLLEETKYIDRLFKSKSIIKEINSIWPSPHT